MAVSDAYIQAIPKASPLRRGKAGVLMVVAWINAQKHRPLLLEINLTYLSYLDQSVEVAEVDNSILLPLVSNNVAQVLLLLLFDFTNRVGFLKVGC